MWIDVRDEVPEPGTEALLTFKGIGYALAEWDGEKFITFVDGDSGGEVLNLCNVTHWMPLPAPPTERKPSEPPIARTCATCENWVKFGVSGGTCHNSRSSRFTDTTLETDGCTPAKKARGDWI